MKKLKKLAAAALALALVASCPAQSRAEAEKKAPSYSGGIRHQNLDFFGSKPCRITASTTAVLCTSSEGIVDAICPSGGTVGQYSLALDSNVAGSRSVTNSDSLVLTPTVFTYVVSTGIPPGGPCFKPEKVRFTNGLVGVQSHAGHTTIIYYHLTGGVNP